MTYLITGIEGFVGHHLFELLKKKRKKVIGTTRDKSLLSKDNVVQLDLLDAGGIKKVIGEVSPAKIILAAGFSSLRESLTKPKECLAINYQSTRNILEAVVEHNLSPKVLTISSAMVYCPSPKPLSENAPLCNSSPYVDSKIRQEKLIEEFPDIEILSARSFNAIGPGQKEEFIVSKLARTFAHAAASGKSTIELQLGNISAERDFLDVRDICAAYSTLLEEITHHRIYNVCSARTHSVSEIIKALEQHTKINALIKQTGGNTKKGEPGKIIGDNTRLLQDTSWRPKILFSQSIEDTYSYWRSKQ